MEKGLSVKGNCLGYFTCGDGVGNNPKHTVFVIENAKPQKAYRAIYDSIGVDGHHDLA